MGGVTRLNWATDMEDSLLIYRMGEPNSAKQPESRAGVRGNLLPEKEDNGREVEPCDVKDGVEGYARPRTGERW